MQTNFSLFLTLWVLINKVLKMGIVKYTFQFTFIVLIVFSCKNSVNDKNEEESGHKKKVSDSIPQLSYSYLSDKEVKKLIDSKSNQFLSAFWPGMTEKQCLEVLRYLIDKHKCLAQIHKDKGEDQYLQSREINSIKLISEAGGYESLTNYELLYRLRTEDQLLDFDLELAFGNHDSLIGINLSYVDVESINKINLDDFNYFIKLYSSKYGKPIDKTFEENLPFDFDFETKDYRRYRFLKNGVSIEIEYKSIYSDVDENGSKVNQIYIYYSEYLGHEYTTYEENRKFTIKWKEKQKKLLQEQQLKQKKKEEENSLDNI